MRALCRTTSHGIELRDIPVPDTTPEHVIVRITACGINPGDKAWIAGAFPEIPTSRYDVCGATASGVVEAIGDGVPREYLGRKVAIYRSLKDSADCVGVWSELARMHYLTCALLPEAADEAEYAASLVSNLTAYVFFEHLLQTGHKAVVCTAGNSATGRSLLGICLARGFPIICLVRTRTALESLDAPNILVVAETDFDDHLAKLSAELGAAAIFDGVGGRLLGRTARALPAGATAYCYGFLAGPEPLDFPSSLLLLKSLSLRAFSVLQPLVRDDETLRRLFAGLQPLFGMPQFKTVPGATFSFSQASQALQWAGAGKAILKP